MSPRFVAPKATPSPFAADGSPVRPAAAVAVAGSSSFQAPAGARPLVTTKLYPPGLSADLPAASTAVTVSVWVPELVGAQRSVPGLPVPDCAGTVPFVPSWNS
jgi:hypothetical protein